MLIKKHNNISQLILDLLIFIIFIIVVLICFNIKYQFDTLQNISQDIDILRFRFGPSSYLFPELFFSKISKFFTNNTDLRLYALTYFQFLIITILALSTFKYKYAIFFLTIILLLTLNDVTILNAYNYHGGLIINILIYLNLKKKIYKNLVVFISSLSNGFTLLFLIVYHFFYPNKNKNTEFVLAFFGYLFLIILNETGIHLFIYSLFIFIIFIFLRLLDFYPLIRNYIQNNSELILKFLFILSLFFSVTDFGNYLYFGINFFLFAEKRYFALLLIISMILLFNNQNFRGKNKISYFFIITLSLFFISYHKYPNYLLNIDKNYSSYKCVSEYLLQNNIYSAYTNLWESNNFDKYSEDLLKVIPFDFKNNIPETFLNSYDDLSERSKFAVLNTNSCSKVSVDCELNSKNLPKIMKKKSLCDNNFELIEFDSFLNRDSELFISTNKFKQIIYNLNVNLLKLSGEYYR